MPADWYVVRSKPRQEEFLTGQLAIRGMETYHPRIRVQTVNPRANPHRSYFPGYLFVRTEPEQLGYSACQYIPGSLGMVSFGQVFPTVPDVIIAAIRERVNEINTLHDRPHDRFRVGDAIAVDSGPLAGCQGILTACPDGSERVRILLRFLEGRQVQACLPVGQIRLDK